MTQLPGSPIHLVQAALPSRVDEQALPWEILTTEERTQAERFRLKSRRQSFVFGRAILRQWLGDIYNIAPQDIALAIDPIGKPRLQLNGAEDIAFNLSHSASFIILAYSRRCSLGVDVEELTSEVRIPLLLRNYFSTDEQQEWSSLPEGSRRASFFRGWTRKEAVWKFFGGPAQVRWEDIKVAFCCDPVTDASVLGPKSNKSELLRCVTWQPAPQTIASVVFKAPGAEHVELKFQSIDLSCQSFELG